MRLPGFLRPPAVDRDAADSSFEEDRPVAGLLERYAESLSPDEEALSRMGAFVRAAFIVKGLEGRDDGGTTPARRGRWAKRRTVAAIGAVAILTLSTFGLAAAESGPGHPLYRLRLNIEAVKLLPASSPDQWLADLARADARLDDVARSAAGSDWNAAADAANAYTEVLAGITLPADPAGLAVSTKRLEGQLARLEQLRASSKAAETPALDTAVAALARRLGIPTPPPPVSPTARPAQPTEGHGDGATTVKPSAEPSHDEGRDRGRSAEPTASNGPRGSGGFDGGSGDGRPGGGFGGSGGGQATPRPQPSDGNGDWWQQPYPPRGGR
jgi:hypothetical protein